MLPVANASGSAPEQGAPVEAVPVQADSSSAVGNSLGVQIIESPGQAATTQDSNAPGSNAAPAASSAPTITLQAAGDAAATGSAADTPNAATAEAPPAPAGGTIAPVPQEKADKADSKTESTSKKKKGIHKVIPF
jgi:hypothetical protein